MNTSNVFTAHSAVEALGERADGTVDDLAACAIDAAIKPVLGRLEAEKDALWAARHTSDTTADTVAPAWPPQFPQPTEAM